MNKISALIVVILFFLTTNSSAREVKPIDLKAECTTKGTDWDGSRNSCHTKEQCQAVPNGFVIVEDKISRKCTSCNGSENSVQKSCRYTIGGLVELLPDSGIMEPTTICVSAHARSPRHNHGPRGWAKCEFTATYVKYK